MSIPCFNLINLCELFVIKDSRSHVIGQVVIVEGLVGGSPILGALQSAHFLLHNYTLVDYIHLLLVLFWIKLAHLQLWQDLNIVDHDGVVSHGLVRILAGIGVRPAIV